MKKKMFFISLIVVATIGFLSLGQGIKNSKTSFLFNSIETLANMEIGVTVTCAPATKFGGKCKKLRQDRCLDGTISTECPITGSPNDNCSALMLILCSIGGQLAK